MAFTAGNTLTTGHVVTASDWNNYLGSTGSIDYLYDKLDDISHNEPGNSLNTIYQNTTGSFRFVTITANLKVEDNGAGELNGTSRIYFMSDGSTPPTVAIGAMEIDMDMYADAADDEFILTQSFSFFVPPTYYYTASSGFTGSGTTPALIDWHEWDLH